MPSGQTFHFKYVDQCNKMSNPEMDPLQYNIHVKYNIASLVNSIVDNLVLVINI